MKYLILTDEKWEVGTPQDGDQVREIINQGSPTQHYRQYVFKKYIEKENKNISALSFKLRMTAQERIAIRESAKTDGVVFDFMDLMNSASFIDLSRRDTQDGVNYLESKGLLAKGRSLEILNNPVKSGEQV